MSDLNIKILITGSSGYVGYILSKYFSEKGFKVVGFDVANNSAWSGNDNFKFYHCDVTDKKLVEEIFYKEKPTHVLHLAFLMSPLHNVKREYEIDVVGSKNVFETANQVSTVKQFIQFSSASAYGAWPKNNLWIKEEQELKPRDYRYGINKKEIEEYYLNYNKRGDFKLVIVRMCTAVGPLYHKKGGVVSLLVNSLLLLKINNRYCELQFIHEDDLTALTNLIINDSRIEGIYNLGPDSYATIKELASDKFFLPIPLWLIRGIIRILWHLRIVKMRPAALTLSTYGIIADVKKIMSRYNYSFKYSTKEAFLETVKKRKEKGTL